MSAIAESPPPEAETFGLPTCDTHLIAKLRNMDPDLRAAILHLPSDSERTGTP